MLPKQKKYCEDRNLDYFAFDICPTCNNNTIDSGTELITGCKKCHRSWCG